MENNPLNKQFTSSMLDAVRLVMEGKPPFPPKKDKDPADDAEGDEPKAKKDIAGSANADDEGTVSGGGRTPVDTNPKTDSTPDDSDGDSKPKKDKGDSSEDAPKDDSKDDGAEEKEVTTSDNDDDDKDDKKNGKKKKIKIEIEEGHAIYTVKGNGKGSKVQVLDKHQNGLVYKIKHNGQMKWVPKHMLSGLNESEHPYEKAKREKQEAIRKQMNVKKNDYEQNRIEKKTAIRSDMKNNKLKEDEEINELSRGALARYTLKAARNMADKEAEGHSRLKDGEGANSSGIRKLSNKIDNRDLGIQRATRRLAKEDVESLDEKAFGGERYTWMYYNQGKKSTISRRGLDHTLAKGSVWGVRHATSSKDKMRVITPEHGPTKVFSLDKHEVDDLMKRSSIHRKKVVMEDVEALDEAVPKKKPPINILKLAKQHVSSDMTSGTANKLTFRRSFHYKNGGTSDSYAEHIRSQLHAAGINHEVLGHEEHWKPFKGGAPVHKQSHWAVHVKLHEPKSLKEDTEKTEINEEASFHPLFENMIEYGFEFETQNNILNIIGEGVDRDTFAVLAKNNGFTRCIGGGAKVDIYRQNNGLQLEAHHDFAKIDRVNLKERVDTRDIAYAPRIKLTKKEQISELSRDTDDVSIDAQESDAKKIKNFKPETQKLDEPTKNDKQFTSNAKKAKLKEEEINELSKKTLGSYVQKATVDHGKKIKTMQKDMKAFDKSTRKVWSSVGKPNRDAVEQEHKEKHAKTVGSAMKANKRQAGIDKATEKLQKEDVDTKDVKTPEDREPSVSNRVGNLEKVAKFRRTPHRRVNGVSHGTGRHIALESYESDFSDKEKAAIEAVVNKK